MMTRACGTYACYTFGPTGSHMGNGCRCAPCRQANRTYEQARTRRIQPAYVAANRARTHIAFLRGEGIGLKTVARRSGVPHGTLSKLIYGDRTRRMAPSKRIRHSTEEKILAVTPADAADGGRIDAAPTWTVIDQLVRRGWTKVKIARRCGQTGPGLQISRRQVTARNARTIAGLLDDPVPTRYSRHGTIITPPDPDRPPPRPAVQLPVFGVEGDTGWMARAACRASDVPTWMFSPAAATSKRCAAPKPSAPAAPSPANASTTPSNIDRKACGAPPATYSVTSPSRSHRDQPPPPTIAQICGHDRTTNPEEHTMTELRDIPVDQLTGRPDNLRQDANGDDLVASIQAYGILTPLNVIGDGQGGYTINAGHRRLDGALKAGLVSVPCMVDDEIDSDTHVAFAMLIENLQRADLTPVEVARGFKRLVDLGVKQKEIAGHIGVSTSMVSRRLTLLKLPDEALDRVHTGDLALETAEAYTKLDAEVVAIALAEDWDVWRVERSIEHAAAGKAREQRIVDETAERAALIDACETAGLPVVDDEPVWDRTPIEGDELHLWEPLQVKVTTVDGEDSWDERRVPGLDDPLDRPELAAHDPPQLGRIGGEDAGQGDRRVVGAADLEDRVEVGTGDQRDVAGEDQDLGRVIGDGREGGPHRVAGSPRLVLEGERGAPANASLTAATAGE